MEALSKYTAFEGNTLFCRGSLVEVVVKIKKRLGKSENSSILIFSDATGKSMDFNFQGTEKDVLKRLDVYVAEDAPKENTGPGRPKLGVVSREVSLLPRHWEWLASQAGGASVTLRKLVEESRKKSLGVGGVSGVQDTKRAQERTYKFMTTMAGDCAGYEDAIRALYKKDEKLFRAKIADWASDVKNHVVELAEPVFR